MVPAQEGDPVAGADARLRERTGQATDPVEQLDPGPAAVLDTQCDGDGLRGGPAAQQLDHVHGPVGTVHGSSPFAVERRPAAGPAPCAHRHGRPGLRAGWRSLFLFLGFTRHTVLIVTIEPWASHSQM
jgi:hypothetical protein